MESLAKELRQKGNTLFKQCDIKLAYTVQKPKLNQAISFYEQSLQHAKTDGDKTSANKNLGVCYYRLFSKSQNSLPNINEVLFYCNLAIRYYLRVFNAFPEIEEKVTSIIEEMISFLNGKLIPANTCLQKLLELTNEIPWKYLENRLFLNKTIACKYLNLALSSYDEKNYIAAISHSNNCLEFANESIYYYKEEETLDTIESAETLIIRSKANIYIDIGNKQLSEAINEDDSCDVEIIYDCLDKYREAYILTTSFSERFTDIELEANICSKIGCAVKNYLKDMKKAQKILTHCISLGLSLQHRNAHTEDWYKKAYNCLQDVRKKIVQEEEIEKSKDKVNIKKELVDIFAELNKKAEGDHAEFIKFILEKHKPKEDLNFNVDEQVKKTNIKKVLTKVIAMYHPDKISDTEMRKKILFEEIAKLLNNKYSECKGLD
jgi:hypothetical protein